MSRKQKAVSNDGKENRRSRRSDVVANPEREVVEILKVKPLVGRTPNQKAYMQSIYDNELTFGVGVSGGGKSYIAGCIVAEMLKNKEIDQIILCRPAVEAGEKLGFLPGAREEKFMPYIEPYIDIFNERLGKSFTEYLIKHGKIIGRPLAYMRSKTFHNAAVVLSECQNTSPVQMELFLTRIGDGCKVVVEGDLRQKDIGGYSGLADAENRLKTIDGIGWVEFGVEDCVRSGLCKKIVKAYSV